MSEITAQLFALLEKQPVKQPSLLAALQNSYREARANFREEILTEGNLNIVTVATLVLYRPPLLTRQLAPRELATLETLIIRVRDGFAADLKANKIASEPLYGAMYQLRKKGVIA